MKLTEARLLEAEYKQLLEDLQDFCEYGYCLQEEKAKDYLQFLVDSINKVRERYHNYTVNEVIDMINTYRFRSELRRNADLESRYFEDDNKTLGAFEHSFWKNFQLLRTSGTKVPPKWIEWIQNAFNRYVGRFEPRIPGLYNDFANWVDWSDKDTENGRHVPDKKLPRD